MSGMFGIAFAVGKEFSDGMRITTLLAGCLALWLGGGGDVLGQTKVKQQADVATPRVIPYRWMSLEKWRDFHAGDLARAEAGPVDVLLIGDSITEAWDKSGLKVWEKKLLPLNAANFGIGGDTTQNVLWRITEGKALEKVRPKVVVLMIGTNNFGLHNDTPEAVVRGVAAVVKTVRKKLPDAHLLLLGIFPRSEHPGDKLRREVAAANEKIAGIGTGDDHIHFLRIWDEFMEKDGSISTKVMPDRLHLTEHGYNIWADTMMPQLKKFLTK